jgi:hypothetical protein
MLTGSIPNVGQVTPIDVLHDDALLATFDFCVAGDDSQDTKGVLESWQTLVHVCRRWMSGQPCLS